MKKGRDDALARERLTRELQTAREIQERLLPHDEPRLSGFEITGASIPSREIGGDYFDFLLQPDDRIGIAIGDVSGKGMPAALLMSNLQASLHGQVIHPSSVAEVVARVNDLLVASTDPHMFATFFYGLLDTRSGVFTTTNAGHNPPLLLRADGTTALLGEGGLLLGMLPDQDYRQQETVIGPGDVVVLYTDGITEAAGPSAEPDDPEAMFGEEALLDVVRRHAHLPAVGIKEAILAAVAAHTAGRGAVGRHHAGGDPPPGLTRAGPTFALARAAAGRIVGNRAFPVTRCPPRRRGVNDRWTTCWNGSRKSCPIVAAAGRRGDRAFAAAQGGARPQRGLRAAPALELAAPGPDLRLPLHGALQPEGQQVRLREHARPARRLA